MPLILSSPSMNNQVFLQEIENDLGLSTPASAKNWVNENKGSVESQLEEYGAVLFSGLPIENAEDFDLFISSFNYDTFTYEESLSNAVRINKTNKVFTANEAPKEIEIFLHHEMAQTPVYPKNIFFFCKSACKRLNKLFSAGLIWAHSSFNNTDSALVNCDCPFAIAMPDSASRPLIVFINAVRCLT